MINSRNKGAEGEREFARWLKSKGIAAKRGQQHSGSPDSPDVIHDLPNIHVEVKRVEKLSIYPAIEQSKKDAGDKTPIVAHRRNNKEWLVTLTADDFINIVQLLSINQHQESDTQG